MKVISLFLAVAFISGCAGIRDYVRPIISDARSTNNKVIDKPREAVGNASVSELGSVPQDHKEAVARYRKAAEQGDANAQNNLGVMYSKGQGVPPSRVVAYALYNLSAANDPSSANIATGHRTYLAGKMLAQEIDAAQNLTREMARPNNLLTALDNYVRHPSVQEQFRQ